MFLDGAVQICFSEDSRIKFNRDLLEYLERKRAELDVPDTG
jgi:hypothetical protein